MEVLKLNILAGRSLPGVKQEGDTLIEVVLNKKAVEYLGFTPEEAIGQNAMAQLGQESRIVGVVDDFNYASLREPIGAYAFHNADRERKNFVLIRVSTQNLANTLKALENTFKETIPDAAFDYTFLDQDLEQLYSEDEKTARVGLLFSILAIFVACLGLFGLAAFTAEQRKKEIGVRKVLGASVLGITRLLSSEFIKLVLAALVIAFPVAYYFMNTWLMDYAFRIEIGWSVFLISGIISLAIAIITVSFQAIKAAIANPVKSLRTE